MSERTVDRLQGNIGSYYTSTKYSLEVYPGGVLRQRDAKPIKLADGEEQQARKF